MSLILDALKKLDREKAAKVGGNEDIAAGILKADDSPRTGSILPLAGVLGVTASVAVIVTYLVVGGSVPRIGDTRAAIPAVPVQSPAASPVPNPTVPAVVAERAPVSSEASQAPPPAVATVLQPERAKKAPEAAAKGSPSSGKETSTKGTPRSDEGAAALPVLKVSGIVWQDVPSERKAVINGRVAREGDTVEGVRVVEIYPTFVNVSFKGRPFKVKMFD
jgi:general secretion pathway protein B